MSNYNLIKQGEKSLFDSDKRNLYVHLEFTSVCSRYCSYCIDGNWDINKPIEPFSNENQMLNAIDKIFNLTDDPISFIIVGGEPTLQPSLPKVIEKIRSRENTGIVLTTNGTQSVEYYKSLDVPLAVSVHFDNNDVYTLTEKILHLKDLVAHARIMAHPDKLNEVKELYNLYVNMQFDELLPSFNFVVERVNPIEGYEPNYSNEYLDYFPSIGPYDCEYFENLKNKLGGLQNFFYRHTWWYDGFEQSYGDQNFKDFYCERNMLVLQSDGKILMNWCFDPQLNIFTDDLPSDLFKTVKCDKDFCGGGYTASLPKWRYTENKPKYIKD